MCIRDRVYAFILHMRMIPGLQGLYAYNMTSLFGLASVIMTYYGVNYYLSGLHSYAAGDPVPVPDWVFIGTLALVALSALAYMRKRRFQSVSFIKLTLATTGLVVSFVVAPALQKKIMTIFVVTTVYITLPRYRDYFSILVLLLYIVIRS